MRGRGIWQKIINSLLLLAIVLIGVVQISYYDYLLLPKEQVVMADDAVALLAKSEAEREKGLVKTAIHGAQAVEADSGKAAGGASVDDFQLDYSLLGVIPIASTNVRVMEPVRVQVGGQAVGLLLQTDGATVVGYAPVTTRSGSTVYPAKDGGMQIGDFILAINGQKVTSDDQVRSILNSNLQNPAALDILVKREGKTLSLRVQPQFCVDSQSYRIGLYIRDNTAGVGTLTYYCPETGDYGALGHPVSDDEEKMTTERIKGQVVAAKISGINKGAAGSPGEKKGVFLAGEALGEITLNSIFGIFGHLDRLPTANYYDHPLEVALAEEIKEGPANIITVLEGEKLESFEVRIDKVFPQHKPTGKGLIITVTDPVLLEKTGGIIQGMSGSPIVQNGKLVGAVTHVFVNDPTRGYGTLAEWMVLAGAGK